MKRILFISMIIFLAYPLYSQKGETENLVILYYNVDNLFDIVDDDGVYDDAFTASGEKFWGEERYRKKLDAIAEDIGSAFGKDMPEIIFLSEIENRNVVKDLLEMRIFRKAKYKQYFNDHPGGKSSVILSSVEMSKDVKIVALEIAGNVEKESASIIYASFSLDDGHKYHFFINNWIERTSGGSGSEPARMNCAVTVRKEVDKILNFERDARIIVLGTFYDEPTNKSILTMLNASNKKRNLNYRDLYNPFYDIHNNNGSGTVVVNGNLQMYDFLIVSPQLLKNDASYYTSFSSGEVLSGALREPLPTFRADEYLEGSSSHFPVILRFSRTIKK